MRPNLSLEQAPPLSADFAPEELALLLLGLSWLNHVLCKR